MDLGGARNVCIMKASKRMRGAIVTMTSANRIGKKVDWNRSGGEFSFTESYTAATKTPTMTMDFTTTPSATHTLEPTPTETETALPSPTPEPTAQPMADFSGANPTMPIDPFTLTPYAIIATSSPSRRELCGKLRLSY